MAFPDPSSSSCDPLRLFVVGCSRGGTTLTQRLISEAFDLASLPETRFYAALVGDVDRRMFPNTARPMPLAARLKNDLRQKMQRSTGRECDGVQEITVPRHPRWSPWAKVSGDFVETLDHHAQSVGAAGWLEKTPFHVLYLDEITRLVPDAWVVHILRDGRDTVASIWDAVQKYDDPWRKVYDRLDRAVDNWNASTAASARMVGRPRQIFLSYDDLTRDPEGMMAAIAARIGRPVKTSAAEAPSKATTPEDTKPAENPNLISHTQEMSWKAGALDGAVRPATSKWGKVLSTEEQEQAQAGLRPMPEALLKEMAQLRENV